MKWNPLNALILEASMSGWFNKAHLPMGEELPDVLRELVNEVRQEKGEL